MNFEEYLALNRAVGETDFHLKVTANEFGDFTFSIRPLNRDGGTHDFKVQTHYVSSVSTTQGESNVTIH